MRYRFLRFPEGKAKAVTFSYDDGCPEDIRLAEILSEYGLKCTFNLNCERLRQKNLTNAEVIFPGDKVAEVIAEKSNDSVLTVIVPVGTLAKNILERCGYLEEEVIVLSVEDNGIGIPEEQLEKLRQLLQANPLSAADTPYRALVNINDRIRIAYGREFGVSVESESGKGTRTVLRLPVTKK